MAVMPDDAYLNAAKQDAAERGAKLYKERDEIAEKMLALIEFVKSVDYLNCPTKEVELISNQLQFMNCYHAVLVSRIQCLRDEQVRLSVQDTLEDLDYVKYLGLRDGIYHQRI